jgi:uncharacterized membrane protein YdjX (TVP38/TMEM64 family)
MKRERIHKIITLIAIIFTIIATGYLIYNSRHQFNRRSLRQIESEVKSMGAFGPLLIFALILINVMIPPLPIPVALIEIAAGMIFGFGPGVAITWIAQIFSSWAAFRTTKYLGKKFLGGLANSKWLVFYRDFLQKQGAFGVFVIRATMSSPFNITYLAGLMQMETSGFLLATTLGVIPEVVMYSLLGNLIHDRVPIRLWYVFAVVVIISTAPILILTTGNLFKKPKVTQLSRNKSRRSKMNLDHYAKRR